MSFFNQFKSAYFYNSIRKIGTVIVVAAAVERAVEQRMEAQKQRAPSDQGAKARNRPWLTSKRNSNTNQRGIS